MDNRFDSANFEEIALDGLAFSDRYKLFTGSVVPRPIALVSSLAVTGEVNLAPFSSFVIASVEDGLLAFSVGPSEIDKHTLTNVRRTREFVINTVSESLAGPVQLCAEDFPPDVSEAAEAGLHVIPSKRIRTPRIAESPIQFECGLHRIVRFGQSHLVVGHVLVMHARTGLVRDYKVDLGNYAPLGRIAGRSYCRVTDILTVGSSPPPVRTSGASK